MCSDSSKSLCFVSHEGAFFIKYGGEKAKLRFLCGSDCEMDSSLYKITKLENKENPWVMMATNPTTIVEASRTSESERALYAALRKGRA